MNGRSIGRGDDHLSFLAPPPAYEQVGGGHHAHPAHSMLSHQGMNQGLGHHQGIGSHYVVSYRKQ